MPLFLFSTSLCVSSCSENAGQCLLTVSTLHRLKFIPLKSRAVNLPACVNRWVRRQVLAGDWSWLHPCSVHLHRPQLIDFWAAIHWTHTICCQPVPDPTHGREQKISACLHQLGFVCVCVVVVLLSVACAPEFVCVCKTEIGRTKEKKRQRCIYLLRG